MFFKFWSGMSHHPPSSKGIEGCLVTYWGLRWTTCARPRRISKVEKLSKHLMRVFGPEIKQTLPGITEILRGRQRNPSGQRSCGIEYRPINVLPGGSMSAGIPTRPKMFINGGIMMVGPYGVETSLHKVKKSPYVIFSLVQLAITVYSIPH
ncbi:hypothetical protein C2S52_021379 [Perilla frutescens var. hirtella]|nr:hypothetical protein C2S52_021379 [Perilla frutescens var. hirtella]